MKRTGKVRNGVIVLDKGCELPEGKRVKVEVVPEGEILSLLERLKGFVGTLEGLPSDFAENHDHYIHGTPKRKTRKRKK